MCSAAPSAAEAAERHESRRELEAAGAVFAAGAATAGPQSLRSALGGSFFPQSMPILSEPGDPEGLHSFMDNLNMSAKALDVPSAGE